MTDFTKRRSQATIPIPQQRTLPYKLGKYDVWYMKLVDML